MKRHSSLWLRDSEVEKSSSKICLTASKHTRGEIWLELESPPLGVTGSREIREVLEGIEK